MWFRLRNTASRGRVPEPRRNRRRRRCRTSREARRSFVITYLAPAPAFLPTLRRITSSEYLMPLPLYGSGSRSARSLAAVRQREHHRMRVAQRQGDRLTLDLRSVADADDVELSLEAVLDAVHHVRHQRAGQTVQRADPAIVAGAGDHELIVLELRAEPRRDGLRQLALGPFGAHGGAVDLDLHSLRDGDGLSADP